MLDLLQTSLHIDDLVDLPTGVLSSLSDAKELQNLIPTIIRLVVIGLLVSACRKAVLDVIGKTKRVLYPTAYVHMNDPAYNWIMSYLCSDPGVQSQLRDFELQMFEVRTVRKKEGRTGLRPAPRQNDLDAEGTDGGMTWKTDELIGRMLPTYGRSLKVKFKGSTIWISRNTRFYARTPARTVSHFQIRTSIFRPHLLKEFIVAVHQAFFATEEQELHIFHPKRINPAWQMPVSRPARPWSSVILPDDVKETILKDMTKFLSHKESTWYATRGIPHRRGYLFHGSPGSGKTTLVTALASKLRLEIYVINPSQRGMDDAKLGKLFRDCPARSIILIEDIDCIFPHGRGRNIVNASHGGDAREDEDSNLELQDTEPDPPATPTTPMVGGSYDLAPSTVTMSGLLNAIDGVSSQEGCVLIATTNYPERLDPALRRAGRFDVQIPFGPAIPSQARALFLHFYPLEDLEAADQSTVTKEKVPREPVTQVDIQALADAFVEAVFSSSSPAEGGESEKAVESSQPGNISMAGLQAYLLKFKEDPRGAVENAAEWAKHAEPEFVRSSSALAPPPPTPTTSRPTGTKIQKAPLRKKVLRKTVKTSPEGTVVGSSDTLASAPAPSPPSVSPSVQSEDE